MTFRALSAVFLCLLLQQCGKSDLGFRFLGEYEATRSEYRIRVLSKGYIQPGDDLSRSGFAAVTFCPAGNSRGTMVRVTLTRRPAQGIKLDCEAFGMVDLDFNRSSAAKFLMDLLSRAGYEDLVEEELQGSATVIMNSLFGPKGVILEGQIEAVRVLHTETSYGNEVSRNEPPSRWIESSEYPTCDTL